MFKCTKYFDLTISRIIEKLESYFKNLIVKQKDHTCTIYLPFENKKKFLLIVQRPQLCKTFFLKKSDYSNFNRFIVYFFISTDNVLTFYPILNTRNFIAVVNTRNVLTDTDKLNVIQNPSWYIGQKFYSDYHLSYIIF